MELTYKDQRKLAAKYLSDWPDLVEVIQNEDKCFPEILESVIPYREEILKLWQDDFPQEWAYMWAVVIGDHDVMRDKITKSKWAYYWALDIGDHKIMRDRVTDRVWIYFWYRDIRL